MPIYEYGCDACGHTLDALQRLSDKQLRKCPECGKPKLKKLVSAPAFRLKGGGWYETDFKSEKEKKRNLADGTEKAKDDAKPKEGKEAKDGKAKETAAPAAKKAEPAKKQPAGKGAGTEAA